MNFCLNLCENSFEDVNVDLLEFLWQFVWDLLMTICGNSCGNSCGHSDLNDDLGHIVAILASQCHMQQMQTQMQLFNHSAAADVERFAANDVRVSAAKENDLAINRAKLADERSDEFLNSSRWIGLPLPSHVAAFADPDPHHADN